MFGDLSTNLSQNLSSMVKIAHPFELSVAVVDIPQDKLE